MLRALHQLIDGLGGEAAVAGPELGPLRPLVQELLTRWPEPRKSLLALGRLVKAGGERWPQQGLALQALGALLSSGDELPRMLCRRPQRLELLFDADLGQPWARERLARQLEQLLEGVDDEQGLVRALSIFRNDHYVRLAACEFLFSRLEAVGKELSALADLCLERALCFMLRQQSLRHGEPRLHDGERCGLVALAMGKGGAEELNFCSDIDLLFVYESDNGAAGKLSLHQFFAKVCQHTTSLLTQGSEEGPLFRVDLRLRPEGSSGPICNSLEGIERYYETWGGPYDRLAWLKARAAAGDLALGQRAVELMRPFVFPRALRQGVVQQIQQLYARIDAEVVREQQGFDVKLGRGGIRQVEFFVQALQLLHAGKQPALQDPATLAALQKLLFSGLISEQERTALAEAYEFWRRIEHRLQLRQGRQTHLLPPDPVTRRWLAQHLRLEDQSLEQAVAWHRQQVEQIFATLSADEEPTAGCALPEPDLPAEQRVEALTGLGFVDPERASERLLLLQRKPWGPLSEQGFAPQLFAEVVRSADPDSALLQLEKLTLRYGPYEGLWRMLQQNPPTARLLVNLFGASEYLSTLFIDHPEQLDKLLLAGRAQRDRSQKELRHELQGLLQEAGSDDDEARYNALRHFRNQELLRIGLHDIAGALVPEQVSLQLSDLAQVILQALYPLVRAQTVQRYGEPLAPEGAPCELCILALGTLGSVELTYGSDLDLVFVYSDEGQTAGPTVVSNAEFFTRLAQRFIGALTAHLEQGRLFAVDTRLRPSGNQGTLVASWEAFQRYHQQEAQLWERQVMIKARPVAGEESLHQQLEAWRLSYAFGSPPPLEPLRQQMDGYRRRLEKELAGENRDFYNLKLGFGGLLDVDFIVQYYQLTHGAKLPTLRGRGSAAVLSALEEQRLVPRQQVELLQRGLAFLRRLEHQLRIVRDRPAERLPRQAAALQTMARRMGYRRPTSGLGRSTAPEGELLLMDYQETTRGIREIYEQIFRR